MYYVRRNVIWRLPVGGGSEAPVDTRLAPASAQGWVVVKEGIYYVTTKTGPTSFAVRAAQHVAFYDFVSSEVRPIALLDRASGALSVSWDRRRLLYSRQITFGGDIKLVKNFR